MEHFSVLFVPVNQFWFWDPPLNYFNSPKATPKTNWRLQSQSKRAKKHTWWGEPPLIIEFRNLHVRFVLVSYGNTCPLKTPISFWAGKKVVLKLVRRLFKTAETRAIFLIMAMNFQKLPSSANALGKATWGSNKRNVKWLFPLLNYFRIEYG